MPLAAIFLEVVWRVPNAPMFVVGLAIVGWALAAGLLAFTGSQASGLPEIHVPQRPVDDPDAGATESDESLESDAEGNPPA